MKMSIAIPTWENNGRGAEFLEDLLSTIEIQTLTDYEVIVSDHSEDNSVKNVVKFYEKKGMNIKHVRNTENRGNGPANTNAAIEQCTGEVVKVMFQDDFFYDDEALEKIYNALMESDSDWLVCGCNHTRSDGRDFYWTLMPTWNNELLKGVNSISSPSVMAFKREKVSERFDENLSMMMDCEMYYRLDKLHGQPVYLHDDLVTNRVHEGQISAQTYSSDDYAKTMEREISHCAEKHL
tara:strand:- start:517 stop:1227 length:711 start_codon:yes stop_codon:yes gene_type:complete